MTERKLRTDVSSAEPEKTLDLILGLVIQKDFIKMDKCGADCISIRLLQGVIATQYEITGLSPAIVEEFCGQNFY